MATREQVWGALFTLLSNDPTLVQYVATFTRRFMLPANVLDNPAFIEAGGRFPVLMLKEEDEETVQTIGTPASREWRGWIVVYTQNTDKTQTGAVIINPIMDAIEAALTPVSRDAMLGRLTLGGNIGGPSGELVYRCWIAGESIKYTGDEDPDGRGGCALPIKIKVP